MNLSPRKMLALPLAALAVASTVALSAPQAEAARPRTSTDRAYHLVNEKATPGVHATGSRVVWLF